MKKTLLILVLISILFSCSKEEQVTEDYSACTAEAMNVTLWPKGEMSYYFEDWHRSEDGEVTVGFQEEDREVIRSIFEEFCEKTGLKTIEYDSEESLLKDYPNGVKIVPAAFKASSKTGMQEGIQELHITTRKYTVLHELSHEFGMRHTFTAANRDEHIIVHYDNILERNHKQFDIQYDGCVGYYSPSIMDYNSYSAAIDKSKPTLTKLNGDTWEVTEDLSEIDINIFKAMYKNEFAKR